MLTAKLERIRDLIAQKERIDAELAQLVGEAEKPRRGRKPKPADVSPHPDQSQQ